MTEGSRLMQLPFALLAEVLECVAGDVIDFLLVGAAELLKTWCLLSHVHRAWDWRRFVRQLGLSVQAQEFVARANANAWRGFERLRCLYLDQVRLAPTVVFHCPPRLHTLVTTSSWPCRFEGPIRARNTSRLPLTCLGLHDFLGDEQAFKPLVCGQPRELRVLRISGCTNLTLVDLRGACSLEHLSLSGATSVREVRTPRTLRELSLSQCPRLQRVRFLTDAGDCLADCPEPWGCAFEASTSAWRNWSRGLRISVVECPELCAPLTAHCVEASLTLHERVVLPDVCPCLTSLHVAELVQRPALAASA